LRYALRHLYDPAALSQSRLTQAFGLAGEDDPLESLRHLMLSAIETLKPDASVPSQAPAWRVYRILYERYVEQFSQDEVATHLGVGTRQIRRQEQQALQILAGFLWTRYDLQHALPILARQPSRAGRVDSKAAPANATEPSRDHELDWLRARYPRETVAIADILRPALRAIGPLSQELEVRVECGPLEALPPVLAQTTGLSQAMAAVLTVAVRAARHGTLRVGAHLAGQAVEIDAAAHAPLPTDHALAPDDVDNLNMAREIASISRGTLQVVSGYRRGEPLYIRIQLPVPTRTTVMVIDDNADTLQLMERYLAHTRYHFAGCADPEQAIDEAEEIAPQVIVLDVMLPGIDGWELLGRLREHPTLRGVPVIVCTILAQEQLASVLGAAGFIRKPISQAAFLAALDQWAPSPAKESGTGHRHTTGTAP
jgi:CheY-like chemotaxis protein